MANPTVFRLLNIQSRMLTSVRCLAISKFEVSPTIQRGNVPLWSSHLSFSHSALVSSSASTQQILKLNTNKEKDGNTNWRSIFSKTLVSSVVGAAFVAFIYNLDTFKNCTIVHAAKVFQQPDYEDTSKRRSGQGLDGGGGAKPPSKRLQFNFIADVVEAVGKSVVCIEMKDHSVVDWVSGKPQAVSNGSGFIVEENGLILTNAHVVVGRNKMAVTVKLHDGRTFAAHVEDVDLNSDLAIVRINAHGLPTMPLGSSCQTRIGEWVVALGSPLSLTNSVTAGVVSSVNRKANDLGIANNISYIQTDAAITFGNSGGPLVNLDGEVIGINSMKVTSGISFAIPIDYVKEYVAQAEARRIAGKSKPRRRYIGATLLTLNADLVAELKISDRVLPISQGVLVWKVVVGSPAYSCGLQPGDIITKVDGKDISSATQIFTAVQVKETIVVEVLRGKSKLSLKLLPDDL